ncbi:TPA: restriction endonuclease subunit S [Vibrio campbellii]|nr:restriction endonuclease subunit S [Vibrio campbellii]
MFVQHVSSEFLTSRVDADFYQPVYVEVENLIKKSEHDELQNISYFVRKGVFDMPSSLYCDEGVPFLRISDFEGQTINIEKSIKIPKWKHLEEYKTILKGGDLVLSKVGTTGKVAKVPIDSEVNISQNLVGISLKDDKVDSDYLLATFNSRHVSLSIERHVTTAVQGKLTLDILRALVVPVFSPSVQTYIGNKIRQAELLREWAHVKIDTAKRLFESEICWDPKVVEKAKFGRIPASNLQNRLDHRFNSIEKVRAINLLDGNKVKLDKLKDVYSISAMVGWKGLTTEHYVDEGPWLLRGVEFSNGVIDFDSLVMVDRSKYLEQPQIHLQEGDVALSKDGTIGKAIVIPKVDNEFAVGSTVARLRKKDVTLDPYYLELALNHEFLQVQVESYATGVAQPHITQEWIAQLLIPRIDNEHKIAELVKKHHLANNTAKQLTEAAKLLVEYLIEGKLTEQELIDAQRYREDGNIAHDRDILRKLTDDRGKHLFPDLTAAYELLEEASFESSEMEQSLC